MTHTIRTSTLRILGASGLAAATIVAGVGVGPAAFADQAGTSATSASASSSIDGTRAHQGATVATGVPAATVGEVGGWARAFVETEQVVGRLTITAPLGTTFAEVEARHVRDDVVQSNYRVSYNEDRTFAFIDGPEDGTGAYWGTANQYAAFRLDVPAGHEVGEIGGGTVTVSGADSAAATGIYSLEVVAPFVRAEVASQQDVTRTAVVTGTAAKGAVVTVTDERDADRRVLGGPVTASPVDGSFEVAVSGLVVGENGLDVSQTLSGMPAGPGVSLTVTVAPLPTIPLMVEFPATGTTTTERRPVFSGLGDPGASIVVGADLDRPVASTTVRADGEWSVRADLDLPIGDQDLLVQQTPTRGEPGRYDQMRSTFTVAAE